MSLLSLIKEKITREKRDSIKEAFDKSAMDMLERNHQVESRTEMHLFEQDRYLESRPRSKSDIPLELSGLFRYGEFVARRYGSSYDIYPFLRYVRDNVPDVSAGVWAWVRVCSTPQEVEYLGGSEADKKSAVRVIEDLDARIFEFEHMKNQGMDALTNAFFLSVFTYGAFAGEVVLKDDRSGVDKFYMIDPGTIQFKRFETSRRLVPYQTLPNEDPIRLNEDSFFYYALDPDGDDPYGRSPLLSLPFVVRIQQQLLEDMAKAMHNAGHPTLHIKYHPQERLQGESITTYQERVSANFEKIKNSLRQKKADTNFLTYDNIEITYIGPDGDSRRWLESHQAVCEQVVSALHLAPFMLGRNWGTTESWGKAQYELIVNNAVSVQRGAKRMCEWLRNLELALAGSPVITKHHFRKLRSWNDLDTAKSAEVKIRSILQILDRGIISKEEAKEIISNFELRM